jgi:predicted aspartyl protease
MLGFSLERGDPQQTSTAIIDSGADATMIPMHYLKAIGAKASEKKWMRGVAGGRYRVGLYPVFLQLGNHKLYISAVGDPLNDEVIVGRDVLNQLVMTLNGLASVVEIKADESD